MSDDRFRRPDDPRSLWARAEAIIAQWAGGELPDALETLRRDPALAGNPDIVLHLAYEEYRLRKEAGEVIDVAAFVDRFPIRRGSLKRLLSIDLFLSAGGGGHLPQPDRWPAPGERLHQFEIAREIGRGGFARVYLARETTAGDRGVVLKVSAEGATEAHALGAHAHPHVVPLYAAPPTPGLSLVVMPYLGTATLDDVLDSVWRTQPDSDPVTGAALLAGCRTVPAPGDPPLPDPTPGPVSADAPFADGVAAVGAGLAAALAFLHGKGLCHRDLKPSNVLLAPNGHPYLLDFNLSARARESAGVAGTIPYMAPEQLAAFADTGPKDYDPAAADVFALGVLLYELLSGRHPFPVDDPFAVPEAAALALRAAQDRGCAALRTANPVTARVVTQCLAAEPAARPTAAAVAAELRRAATGRPRKPRGPLTVVTALTTAVGLALGVGVVSRPSGPFDRAIALMDKGEEGVAVTEFIEIGNASRDGRAFAYAAYCFAKKKDYEKTLWSSDQAIDCGREGDAVVKTNRAFAHFQSKHLTEALADSNAAVAADPSCMEARFLRAEIAVRLDELNRDRTLFPQAIDDLGLVRTERPHAAEASRLAAKMYAKMGKLDEAAEAVREAISRGADPKTVARDPAFVVIRNHPVFKKAVEDPPVNRAAPLPLLPLRPRY